MSRKGLALLLIAMLLSGCTGSFDLSADALMSPPKLTDEQAEIYSALVVAKGEEVNLAYPKAGEYLSAYVVRDLDSEPTDEAMVFYRETGIANETTLRVNFLDQQDGRWVSVLDLPAYGTDIEWLTFRSLGSGQTEILIAYSVLNQTDRAISVIRYEDRTVTDIFKGSYSYLEITDVDADGAGELFLINYDSGMQFYTAYLLGFTEGVFETYSSVPLSADAVSFIGTTLEQTSSHESMIYLDYSKGDSVYGTQVINCYGKNMTVLDSGETLSRRTNSSMPMLRAMDVDGDGTVEIPATTPFVGYENLARTDQLFMVDWYAPDGKLLQRKFSSFYSGDGSYLMKIPGRWEGLVTVSVSANVTAFAEYTDGGEVLLEIYHASDDSAPDKSGWSEFANSVYVRRSGRTGLQLTEDELADCLLVLGASGE